MTSFLNPALPRKPAVKLKMSEGRPPAEKLAQSGQPSDCRPSLGLPKSTTKVCGSQNAMWTDGHMSVPLDNDEVGRFHLVVAMWGLSCVLCGSAHPLPLYIALPTEAYRKRPSEQLWHL